jgi:CPA2 family monovalent cation:H+ antiporter-2
VAFGSAKLFDVSVALGAFFAGMVISGSDLSHSAATYLQPLQDVFAALFFVAMGMLFEPTVLVRHPLEVLEVLAIIVIGKSLAAMAIVRLLGRPLGTALTVAAALAQIGEFSFILAIMGVGMEVLPPEGQNYIVAGALLSIVLNPLLFAALARLRPAPRAAAPAAD